MRRGDILQFSEIEFLVRSNNQKRDSCIKTRFRLENSEKNKIRGGGAELSNIVFLLWSSLNFVIQRYCSVMNQLAKAEENHRVKCGDVKKCSQ